GPEGRGGINILFWGPPGTGKTEFAKYLAHSLGVALIVKRSSDLDSMWVGMTEKNIAAAFREAVRAKAILFIDEADSFFSARENAFRSWEVSRTNEFLTQMENHSGILICCTNLLPSMDRAAMRRFTWKIEFGPLRNDDKVGLYVKYFGGKDPLTPAQKLRIASIGGLTPGDLKAVWQRYRYVSKCEMDHELIIKELENEIKYRVTVNIGKIGF
ncbi:MAG TPA: ATP-binding protein, partial [Atribacteraceae bacterium]|nr:ATP-binding protein [Atribacteraceae bacterium]